MFISKTSVSSPSPQARKHDHHTNVRTLYHSSAHRRMNCTGITSFQSLTLSFSHHPSPSRRGGRPRQRLCSQLLGADQSWRRCARAVSVLLRLDPRKMRQLERLHHHPGSARGHARCCAARRLRYSYTVRCMTHRTPFSLSAARAETEHETTETTHRHTRKGVARSTGCANRETLDHLTLKAVMRASGSPLLATDLLSRDRDQSG